MTSDPANRAVAQATTRTEERPGAGPGESPGAGPAAVTKRATFFAAAAGFDERRRPVMYATATGSEEDPAILAVTDLVTAELIRTVRLPGATGSWSVQQNPVTGTVYIGSYGRGSLWLYTPGESAARDAGPPPIPDWDFGYDIAFDGEGVAYGGGWGEPTSSYPRATVYRYHEQRGFTGVLGSSPLVTDAYYTRALAFDETTQTVFVGTGTNAHLVACDLRGGHTDVTDQLGDAAQDVRWVGHLTAAGGYLTVWAGDRKSAGNDTLMVLRTSRRDGDLHLELLAELPGVTHGATGVVDGRVYYTLAGHTERPLHCYDLTTGEQTSLDIDPGPFGPKHGGAQDEPGIFTQHLDIVDLDQPDWTGPTLVGWNSSGVLLRSNLGTGTTSATVIDGVPEVSLRVNSIATSPDGRIVTSGYLTGGIGVIDPLRPDAQRSFPVGGQAEQMMCHAGRIYQGIYPSGTITSFTLDELEAGLAPRLEFAIGSRQFRPYALCSHGHRLYFGSQAGEGYTYGAFGWFDPNTGEHTTITGPLGHQSINAVCASGSLVFGGGNIFFGYDGLPLQCEASLMVFDETTERIDEIRLPVRGLRAVSALAADAAGLLWCYAEGWLLALDPRTRTWVAQERIFGDRADRVRISGDDTRMLTGADGTIYGNAWGRVFAFDPAAAANVGIAAAIRVLHDGDGPHLAIDHHGTLYVREGKTRLLRVATR